MASEKNFRVTEEEEEVIRQALKDLREKLHGINVPAIVLVGTRYNDDTDEADFMGVRIARTLSSGNGFVPRILRIIEKLASCPGLVRHVTDEEIDSMVLLINKLGNWRNRIVKHEE